MILAITKTKFEVCIPSAIDPESGLFERVQHFMEGADMMLRTRLLGDALYQALQDAFSPIDDEGETLPASDFRQPATISMIAESVQHHIINMAMALAIPQLDLILTSSGFGVVSSSQIAPASRERVENLRRSCLRAASTWRDSLLMQLLGNSITQPLALASLPFIAATSSLFWTEEHLASTVSPVQDPSSTLAQLRPQIHQAEVRVAGHISRQQLDALFVKMRQSNLTDAQLQVIADLRYVVSLLISTQDKITMLASVRYFFRNIYDVMEDNPNDFAEYIASSIYTGRHAPIYENKAQDPLFALL